MTRLLRLAAAAAAAAIAVAACSSGDDSTTTAGGTTAAAPSATSAPATGTSAPGGGEGAGSAAGGALTIKDFKYGEPLTVAPGATITVTNEDTAGHNVVSDTGEFKTATLGKGEKTTFTAPTKPGTYKFSCSLHPGSMSGIGTLIVQG